MQARITARSRVAQTTRSPRATILAALLFWCVWPSLEALSATLYVDGAAVASTAVNNGSYVAMEGDVAAVELGKFDGDSGHFNGKMAGGPLGPWFVTHNAAGIITADQVRALYDLGRAALAL